MTVYKYVTPDRIDVLTTGYIRFTQAAATNDPFELRPFFESLVTEEFVLKQLGNQPIDLTPHLVEQYNKQPAEVKEKVSLPQVVAFMKATVETPEGQAAVWRLLRQFLTHLDTLAPTLSAELAKQLGAKVGILSLSEVPDSPLMWAHYAANHTGFVIRFSEKHPYFDRRRSDTDEFLHLRRVRYVQDIRYRALIELTGQEIFVTKKADWSYEKEWRMLAPLEMADKVVTTTSEPVYLFAVPADCIEGVILGAKASNATRDTLSEVRFGDPRFRHLTLAMARIAFDQQAVKIDPLEGTA